MNRSVTCYPVPGKPKARLLCEAFADGVRAAGGVAHVCTEPPAKLQPGAAVFYGVRPAVAHLWRQAKAEGRDWCYIDNSYFDVARERQFRITKNAIQHDGRGESDGRRFKALGVPIAPMRAGGDYLLLCEQSAEFMEIVAGERGWSVRMAQNLRQTHGEVRIRRKGARRPLADELAGAGCVATWSSAAAIEAVLAGVPSVLCADACAARHVGVDRERWARVLADNQWTLDEIRRGDAWKASHA